MKRIIQGPRLNDRCLRRGDGLLAIVQPLEPRVLWNAALNGELAFQRQTFADGALQDTEVFVIRADGTGERNFTNDPGSSDWNPAWSGDGSKLTWSGTTPGVNFEIFTANPDGSGRTQVTTNPNGANDLDFDPDFSPDGSKIVFESGRDHLSRELYVIDADGSNPTRLTFNTSPDVRAAWSPDGTKIAFVSSRDGNQEIYVINADGSNPTRVTNAPGSDFWPSWSPDGTKLAFSSDRDGDGEIYVMNAADGSDVTRITFNPGLDGTPAWSPDGAKIAFASLRDNVFVAGFPVPTGELYVMNADGSDQTRITFNDAIDTAPDWRPRSAAQALEDVIARIDELAAAGDITNGQANSLISGKLEQALRLLTSASPDATQVIHHLQLFLDRASLLPQPEQDSLVEAVEQLIASLQL